MPTALLLVIAGVLSRLIPHPVNFVPLGAIALYAAARLPRQWALAIPLAVLVLSDAVIDLGHGYPFYFTSRLTIYVLFVAIVAMGWLVPKSAGMGTRLAAAAGAATVFFLVSNFAVWAGGEGFGFPRTFGGLISTYHVALPFYRNGLLADLAGTVVLFGLDALLSPARAGGRQGVEA
jgi:hypothetical protein